MTADQVKHRCIEARQRFYSLASIFRRSLDFKVNARNWFMWTHFFSINLLFRSEVLQRTDFPLGDESFVGPLLKARHPRRSAPPARGGLMRSYGKRWSILPCRPTTRVSAGCVRSQAMPGRISLALPRDPDFSLGCAVTGDQCRIVVARSVEDGAIVGVACRSIRHVVRQWPGAADRLSRSAAG